MSFVDGFLLPVPRKNLPACWSIARKAGKIWREHGALEYHAFVADDAKPGKLVSLPQSVKLKRDEAVVFVRILYKSRAHCDRVNASVRKDPRLADMILERVAFAPAANTAAQ